ncbi:hypothetical protein SeMB42_g03581 [Synchytrium endobioticum]|uniref:Mediator complex subunit 15 KIX domain-containing protein n=1 Tax=Synchytrium endobioticum TaxID=286115 RepID=A0A507D613_9FUNG|nr:hypothetical protein SeLEV6574_g04723 [Synchytrium endobioticum]TPX46707.1 hypothetical protein SeMB42_g03581 [Synchytrium endobioticum]
MAQRPDPNTALFNSMFNANPTTNGSNANQLAQMLQYSSSNATSAAATPNTTLNNQQLLLAQQQQQQQARIQVALSQMMQTGSLPSGVLNSLPLNSQMQLLQTLQQSQAAAAAAAAPGVNMLSGGEWRQSLSAAERQSVINNLITTVRNGMPEKQRNEQRINDLARQVEQQIYDKATGKDDYLLKVQTKVSNISQKLTMQGQQANAAAAAAAIQQAQQNPVLAANTELLGPGVLGPQRPLTSQQLQQAHLSQQAQQLLAQQQQHRNAQVAAAAAQAVRPQLTPQQQQQARLLAAAQNALRAQSMMASGRPIDPRQQAAVEAFIGATGMQPQQYLQAHQAQVAHILQQQQQHQQHQQQQQQQNAAAAVPNPALSLAGLPAASPAMAPFSNLTSPLMNQAAVPTPRQVTNSVARPQGVPIMRSNGPVPQTGSYRPGPNVTAVNVGTVNAATSSAAAVAAVVSQVQAQCQQGANGVGNGSIPLSAPGSTIRLREWQLSPVEAQQVTQVMNELQPLYSKIDDLIKMFPQNNDAGREKMKKIEQMKHMMREQYEGLQRPVPVFYLNPFMVNQLKANMHKLLQYVDQYNLKGLPSPAPTPGAPLRTTPPNTSSTISASPPRIPAQPMVGAASTNPQLVAAQAQMLTQQAQAIQASRASAGMVQPGMPVPALASNAGRSAGLPAGAPPASAIRPGIRPNLPSNSNTATTRTSPSRRMSDGSQALTSSMPQMSSPSERPFWKQAQQVEKVLHNYAASNAMGPAAGGVAPQQVTGVPPPSTSQPSTLADSLLIPVSTPPSATQLTGFIRNNKTYQDTTDFLKDMTDDLNRLVADPPIYNAFLNAEFSAVIERKDGYGSWPEDLDQLGINQFIAAQDGWHSNLNKNNSISSEDAASDYGLPLVVGKGWGMGFIVEDDDEYGPASSFLTNGSTNTATAGAIFTGKKASDSPKEADDLTVLSGLECLSPPPSPPKFRGLEDDEGPMRKRPRQLEAM